MLALPSTKIGESLRVMLGDKAERYNFLAERCWHHRSVPGVARQNGLQRVTLRSVVFGNFQHDEVGQQHVRRGFVGERRIGFGLHPFGRGRLGCDCVARVR